MHIKLPTFTETETSSKQTYSRTLVQAKDYQGLVHGNHPYASGCDATSTTANINAEGHATLTLLHFLVIYLAGHLVMFPGLILLHKPACCTFFSDVLVFPPVRSQWGSTHNHASLCVICLK